MENKICLFFENKNEMDKMLMEKNLCYNKIFVLEAIHIVINS